MDNEPDKNDDAPPPVYEPPTNALSISPLEQATTSAMRLWLVQWFAAHDVAVAGLDACFAHLAWTGRWVTTQPAERLEADLRGWGFDSVHAHMIVADLEEQKVREIYSFFKAVFGVANRLRPGKGISQSWPRDAAAAAVSPHRHSHRPVCADCRRFELGHVAELRRLISVGRRLKRNTQSATKNRKRSEKFT
jgi:hypothetical protein